MRYFLLPFFGVLVFSCAVDNERCRVEVERYIKYEQNLNLDSDIMFVFQHQDSVIFVNQKKPYDWLLPFYYSRKGGTILNNKTVVFEKPIKASRNLYKLFRPLKYSASDVSIYGYNSNFNIREKVLGSIYILDYKNNQNTFLHKVYEGDVSQIFYYHKQSYCKPKLRKIREPKPSLPKDCSL